MKNKKGVSEVIAYVLLIVVALSIALLVYPILKSNLIAKETKCPDGVSLSLIEQSCSSGVLSLTLKNNGLFRVEGIVVRAGNSTKGLATYNLKGKFSYSGDIRNYFGEGENSASMPGNTSGLTFTPPEGLDLSTVQKIEIQPFVYDGKNTIFCDAVITQSIQCSD